MAKDHPGMALACLVGLFALAQTVIWGVVLGSSSATDTDIYYGYAGRIIRGEFPYRDFEAEYPPVAMLIFLLPRLLSGPGYEGYIIAFEAEMLFVSWGILAILAVAAWRQARSLPVVASVLAAYTFFLLALGIIIKARFDLVVALIMLAALVCFLANRHFAAWTLLGVGIMTKMVPLLLAPLFLIIHLRRRQWPALWMGPLVMLLTAAIIAVPFLMASPSGLADSFLYHVERPLQMESSWSSALMLLHMATGYPLRLDDEYGSHNIYSAASDNLSLISGPVALMMLAGAYFVFWRRCQKGDDRRGPDIWLIRFAAAAIAIFIFSGKVFSPQFLIWLMPLIPLVRGRDWPFLNGLFAAVLLLTQWEFPYHYWDLYMLKPTMIVETATRNLLVGLLALILVLGPVWRKNRGGSVI